MDEWTSCKFYLSFTAWRETRGDGERNDKGILNGRKVSLRSASTATDAWDTLSNKWNWNKESWNNGLAKMKQWNKAEVTNLLLDNLRGIIIFFSISRWKLCGDRKALPSLTDHFITNFKPFGSIIRQITFSNNCLKTYNLYVTLQLISETINLI